jgi:class 3 adenylate cyclase/tetratricopeptide (TPR) repeat protein
MGSETGGLRVFLPWSIYPLLKPGAKPSARLRGTVLFCDVAGFTPMTEALSVMGREGSETLTRILNGYFTRMIGILSARGGDVLRFGGDAMTVFFPGDDGPRAASAALEMMAAMGEFAGITTPAGSFSLSMKIGAASGEVLLGLLGQEGGARDYYAAGRPLDDAAEAEHHASPGLVVLHPSFSQAGTEGWKITRLDGGFSVLREAPEARPSPPPFPPPSDAVLRSFIPSHLAELAGEGTIGEHRGTAVAFISIAGLNWDDPEVHGRVDGVFSIAEGAAKRYGGTLNKLDMGDKGAKALILFGAPYACEAREEMAARCVLDILREARTQPGLVLKAGITSAPLFSGPVGAPSRREFTVMGDGVNLAARLMAAAAPGRALCSKGVADAASAAINFRALDPIRVKGKAEPVPVFLLEGERLDEAPAVEEALVGRDEILAELKASLFGARAKPILIVGQAGMGKSALARRLAEETRQREIPLAVSALSPFHATQSYGAWRPIALRLTGATRHDPPSVIAEARNATLADEPEGFRPLLNPLLGLAEEETPATRGLSPKERRDAAFGIFKRLLARSGERVLILDGLCWADPLSLDLLEEVLREAPEAPWRLVAFTRPLEALQERFKDSAAIRELARLPAGAMGGLLQEAHGLEKPSEAVLRWFEERAAGNPGIASALVEVLKREGLLVKGASGRPKADEDRLFAAAFPTNLEALYLRQVEALPAAAKRLLQRAAILGFSVSLEMLKSISEMEDVAFEGALEVLEKAGFLVRAPHGARPYRVFGDPLLQVAVYDAAPFELRRETHASVLRFLEADPAANAPALWPLLARHAEGAGDEARAKQYHRLAGRDAAKRFDNVNALEHLEFVCRMISAEKDDVEDCFSLMEILMFLGHAKSVVALLARLIALDPQLPAPMRGRLRNYMSSEASRAGQMDAAENYLLEGEKYCGDAGDIVGRGKAFLNLAGIVYGPSGRLEEAKACLEKALALPKGKGQAIFRVMALVNLGSIAWHEGDIALATSRYADALSRARRANLPRHEAFAAYNLLAIHYEEGQYMSAARVGKRALILAQALSLREVERTVLSSLALTWTALGQLEFAEEAAERVRAESAHEGNAYWQALATQTLAHVAFLKAEYARALELSDKALAACAKLGEKRHMVAVAFERLRQFYYLGLTDHFEREIKAAGGREALLEAAANEKPLQGLVVLLENLPHRRRGTEEYQGAGVRGQGPGEKRREEALTPDARLLEWSLCGGQPPGLKGVSLSHEEKVRLAYARILSPQRRGDAEKESRSGKSEKAKDLSASVSPWLNYSSAWRLLRKAPAGVWGLRLWGLLYAVLQGGWEEREAGKKAAQGWHHSKIERLRQEGLRALYQCRAQSPTWVWEKIVAFPEIKALIKGEPSRG